MTWFIAIPLKPQLVFFIIANLHNLSSNYLKLRAAALQLLFHPGVISGIGQRYQHAARHNHGIPARNRLMSAAPHRNWRAVMRKHPVADAFPMTSGPCRTTASVRIFSLVSPAPRYPGGAEYLPSGSKIKRLPPVAPKQQHLKARRLAHRF